MNRFELQQIEHIANDVIKNHNISSLPVDPFQIARSKTILLESKSGLSKGVSGMLIRLGEEYAIAYRNDISNEGYIRFSVAHELGHFFLPQHPESVFNNMGIHNSKAGFNSDDKYEQEADRFAAALLMPSNLFQREMYKANDGLEAVEMLSALCKTSIEATAIRYIQETSIPAAVIRSQNDRIDYCFMSNSMKDLDNFTWIKKGVAVPTETETYYFNKDKQNIKSSQKASDETDLSLWLDGCRSIQAFEEVVGLGDYGKTLTIITSETFSDDTYDDDKYLHDQGE
jgi:Zn-dependent peptidase ImmA (M78 family)